MEKAWSYRDLKDKEILGQLVALRNGLFGLHWAIFAGTGCFMYGSSRIPTDIDILLRDEEVPLVEKRLSKAFGEEENKFEHSLKLHLGRVEVVACLFVKTETGRHHFCLDELMFAHIKRRYLLGRYFPVLSREDIIVLKAMLRRGLEAEKHDFEDIRAIWSDCVDTDYIKRRAFLCDASKIVSATLDQLDIRF
jgi:hypothetical protein